MPSHKKIVQAKLKKTKKAHFRALMFSYVGLVLMIGFQNCSVKKAEQAAHIDREAASIKVVLSEREIKK